MPRAALLVLCALRAGVVLADDAAKTDPGAAPAEAKPADRKKKRKRAGKDWSKVDLDAVDREWEGGDEADELKTESQFYEETVERRRDASEGGWMDPATLTRMDPKIVTRQLAHQQSETGAAMIFVALTEKQMTGANKGDGWHEKAEQQFAGIVTALLKTGGLNVQAYRIGERKLLLSTMTGWYGKDVVEFLVEQPSVMKVTWDSVDTLNPNAAQTPDPEGGPAPAKPKPPRRKKCRRKKKKADSGDL